CSLDVCHSYFESLACSLCSLPLIAFSLLQCAQANNWKSAKSIYEFSAKDIDGNEVSLEKYRGFVCIITNVASK
uniref:Glutathione peroxidase 4a n=1 Tax=Pygocentrus nattereri TaxID=42514 RepID=A0A3B4D7M2_PYGNA